MVIQMQFSDDDGRLGAIVPRRPALQGAEVLAVTGLSGILGIQNRLSPPHNIYTINENKIEA